MSISVVIPVYNSEEILDELNERLADSLKKITDDYEIILVDDFSADHSWDTIVKLAKKDNHVKGFHLSRNFGQHNAILCGIRESEKDVIITMDDDLQHPPEELHKLIDKLNEDYDVIYGIPETEKHGFLRNFASRITKLALASTMGAETASNVCSLRAFRSQLKYAFANYDGMHFSIDALLTWGTSRFSVVKMRHEVRKSGKSNYTLRKLITHGINLITGFSTLPLQIASLIGFMFTLFGLSILVYVVAQYFINGNNVPGFPFLASIIAIFSGAQLFCLGIIGEYLSRVHHRTIKRPTYLVRSTTFEIAKPGRTPSET